MSDAIREWSDTPAPDTGGHAIREWGQPKKPMGSAPQPSVPFGRVSAPELGPPTGDAVLENMKKPGQAYQQLLAHPRQPMDALNVLVNSEPDSQADTNRTRVANALGSFVGKPKMGENMPGLGKAAVDAWFDPTSLLGGSGLIEKGANALGRAGFIGASKVAEKAPLLSRAMDYVSPGGSKMGALKRGLAATENGAGLDKFTLIRSIAKRAENAGTDVRTALTDVFGTPPKPKPNYRPVEQTVTVPQAKPHFRAVTKTVVDKPQKPHYVVGQKTVGPESVEPGPAPFGPNPAETLTSQPTFTKVPKPGVERDVTKFVRARRDPQYATKTKFVKGDPLPLPHDWRNDMLGAFKGNKPGEPNFLGDLSKKLTKGTTSAMFISPQLPLMEGHGSNVLQTALLSDPVAASKALAGFAARGDAIPFSKLREAYQKLPGVRDLVADSEKKLSAAKEAGAVAGNPDFGQGESFFDKIPGVGMMARESERGLSTWDNAAKSSLYDHWNKKYLADGHSPAMASAKATERVGQDVVDYGDLSDATKGLKHVLPFATYASKKPGIVARAILRHPERVLAAERDNPNFDQERDEKMEGFDSGRPLSSIFNAMNNKAPGSKAAPSAPGSQYARASAGDPARDLLSALGAHYFTYGDPAKHGDEPWQGWAKLLLSQTAGNLPGVGSNPIPGQQDNTLLKKLGLDYFGDH